MGLIDSTATLNIKKNRLNHLREKVAIPHTQGYFIDRKGTIYKYTEGVDETNHVYPIYEIVTPIDPTPSCPHYTVLIEYTFKGIKVVQCRHLVAEIFMPNPQPEKYKAVWYKHGYGREYALSNLKWVDKEPENERCHFN